MKLLTFQKKTERFPPIACRLLARYQLGGNNVKAKTDEDIARDSGLTLSEVKYCSWSTNWDGISVRMMFLYLKGCGIDFDDRLSVKYNTEMMKAGGYLYLRKDRLWESQFKPMVAYWLETRHV